MFARIAVLCVFNGLAGAAFSTPFTVSHPGPNEAVPFSIGKGVFGFSIGYSDPHVVELSPRFEQDLINSGRPSISGSGKNVFAGLALGISDSIEVGATYGNQSSSDYNSQNYSEQNSYSKEIYIKKSFGGAGIDSPVSNNWVTSVLLSIVRLDGNGESGNVIDDDGSGSFFLDIFSDIFESLFCGFPFGSGDCDGYSYSTDNVYEFEGRGSKIFLSVGKKITGNTGVMLGIFKGHTKVNYSATDLNDVLPYQQGMYEYDAQGYAAGVFWKRTNHLMQFSIYNIEAAVGESRYNDLNYMIKYSYLFDLNHALSTKN